MTEKLFVIRKGGYYYRPNAQGYTASLHEAGRYPEAEAIAHMEASDPGDITIIMAPAIPLPLTLPQDIAATAETIVLEHVTDTLDLNGAHLERLAIAIATALEAERVRYGTPAPQPISVASREEIARIIDPVSFNLTPQTYGTDGEGFKRSFAYGAQLVALERADAVIAALQPKGDLLHSAMSLMETIAESLPDDDMNAIMLSVMAGNIRSALAKLGDQP